MGCAANAEIRNSEKESFAKATHPDEIILDFMGQGGLQNRASGSVKINIINIIKRIKVQTVRKVTKGTT